MIQNNMSVILNYYYY